MKRNGKPATAEQLVATAIANPRLQLRDGEQQAVKQVAALLGPIFASVAEDAKVRFLIAPEKPLIPEVSADVPAVFAATLRDKHAALMATVPVDADPIIHIVGDTQAAVELITVAEAITRANAIGKNIRAAALTQICQRATLQAANACSEITVRHPAPAARNGTSAPAPAAG